jgi:hypothetical protein
MELQYMQLTAARAVHVMQQQVQQVHDSCVALGWQLPAKPARPVLLQCTPDLLCADWEALQKLLEAPAVAPQAALEATAGSMAAAVAAAMGVVQALAQGNKQWQQQVLSRPQTQRQPPLQQLVAYSSSSFLLVSSGKSSRINRYLVKAGRSAISGSFTTYVSNLVKAFGDRLTYMRDVGLTWLTVVFKPSMLDW